ncbi:uncharacterized protein TNCT_707851 [Trichonephila clavata]|uniref:Uncharacterized protein n=1 Tax=Trichonephila clavata TaxID=2740835 RepID=A0A8X6JKW2_TRICU|nr:uncharacterized protein TNCT_707851 [Trichonephila clavata]
MSNSVDLLRNMFGTFQGNYRPLMDDDEIRLAELFYNVAADEISLGDYSDDDAASVVSFEEKFETTHKNLTRVVGLFRKTKRSKRAFLKNFEHWKKLRLENIKKLKEIAREIQSDKYNGCIAKIVGGSIGIVGGAIAGASLLCPPLAVVTVPLAIGGGVASFLGGGVIVGTTGTELVLLKKKLEEAKALINEEEENFSRMEHWFTHSEELVEAIEELIGEDLLKNLMEEGQNLLNAVKKASDGNLTTILKEIMKKICESSNIVREFGIQIAPIVISFVLVACVISGKHRFVLNCALMTQSLMIGLTSTTDVGVGAGRLVAGLAMNGTSAAAKILPGTIGRAVALGTFVALGIALDVLNVVLASIAIHKGARSSQADEVLRVANLLEEEYSFLLNVYGEIKNYK